MFRWLAVALGCATSVAARAEILFSADSRSGSSAAWHALGTGVDVAGWRSRYLRVQVNSTDPYAKGSCRAQYSLDDGRTWTSILSNAATSAGGATTWTGQSALPGAGNRLLMRLDAESHAECRFDNLALFGLRTPSPASLHFPLRAGSGFDAPVDFSAFWPMAALPLAPRARVEGELRLDRTPMPGWHQHLREAGASASAAERELPALHLEIVQQGNRVLPVQRGLIQTAHPAWNWIFEPGVAWEDPASGALRVSLPFALQERNANCTHNGMLVFQLDDQQRVAAVAFQIAAETCQYFKFDAWGVVPARFVARPVPARDAVLAADDEQRGARPPARPIGELGPGVALQLATAAGPEPTVYGALINGTYYRSECATRQGNYPACDDMTLPSYSVAKSIFAGVALMRLEKIRPGARSRPVPALVEACDERSWHGVTLEHLLDMTTGHFRSARYMVDEDSAAMAPFFSADTHAGKLRFACNFSARRARAGTRWVYHTTDTYLAGTAMTQMLGGDPYEQLLLPIWRQLRLSSTLSTTLRSADTARQPYAGWGLWYHGDDIVRIAYWLTTGAGTLLDSNLLAAALHRGKADPGRDTGLAGYRYRLGFWARDLGPAMGCSRPVWTPFMSGYGGISVVMLPGGPIFQSHGDDAHWDWSPAIALLDAQGGCG